MSATRHGRTSQPAAPLLLRYRASAVAGAAQALRVIAKGLRGEARAEVRAIARDLDAAAQRLALIAEVLP